MITVNVMDPDISPNFRYNLTDTAIARRLVHFEGTPEAIVQFSKLCDALSDYSYWFLLGTLWVSYSGQSDLQLWKRLFKSRRPNRTTSLMKPSEVTLFERLPDSITAYRAHRRDETDWIAYTLDPVQAGKFAVQRDVDTVTEYRLRKRDVIALFRRRGETEVLMLDPARARQGTTVSVVIVGEGPET